MPPQENNPAPIPVGMQRPSRSAPHGLTTGKLGTPPELRARPGRRAGVEEGGGWGVLAPASAGLCPPRHVRTPKKPGCSAIPCTGGHLRLAIRRAGLSAGDGDLWGHSRGVHPAPAARRLGPLSLAHEPGNHGGPRPGADPVLPGGLGAAAAAARAVAKAHGSPGAAPAPGPPALCNHISPATAGGTTGDTQHQRQQRRAGGWPCIALLSEPAGQLGGVPGGRPPPQCGGLVHLPG